MIGILNYGAGNLRSVQNALDRIGVEYFTSNNPEVLARADKIIFPGQGRVGDVMNALKRQKLDVFLKSWEKPFLGICIGMQVLFEYLEEDGVEGLGIIPGKVIRFDSEVVGKVPHMGWNGIRETCLSNPLGPPCQGEDTEELLFVPYNAELKDFAREMRRNPTAAEKNMWEILKDPLFEGLKFTRQKPLLGFIADFYCAKRKLVIEVDGEVHQEQEEYDEVRDEALEDYGITVLRFPNEEVLHNPNKIKEKIINFLKSPLTRGFGGLINKVPNYVYFVHSFYAPVSKFTTETCNYGIDFSAAVQKDNFVGMQFHPEKSGELGETFLKNFCNMTS